MLCSLLCSFGNIAKMVKLARDTFGRYLPRRGRRKGRRKIRKRRRRRKRGRKRRQNDSKKTYRRRRRRRRRGSDHSYKCVTNGQPLILHAKKRHKS